ncbi:MAG: hypothetical protein J6104_06220, partial [Methanomicrobium sp.]|nr:hypothetical protein [Methanomicrobium sp.]
MLDGIDLSGQSGQSDQSKKTAQGEQIVQTGQVSYSGIGTIADGIEINAVTTAEYSKADLAEATTDGDTVFITLSGNSASV